MSWHLALFAGALIVPIVAFVAFLLWQYSAGERTRLETGAAHEARSIAVAIDRELTGLQGALEVLSLSPTLQNGDLAGFYEGALEVERRLGVVAVLRDPAGQQLVNPRRAFDQPLPRVVLPVDAQVFERRRAVVSDLFTGQVAAEPLFAVVQPVLRRGTQEVISTLSLSLTVERLRAIVADAEVPPEWTVAVVDRAGIIMARNRDHAAFVGKPATPDLARGTTGREGTWRGTTVDGRAVFGAYARTGLSDWRVAVGIREADLGAPLRRSLWLLAGLGAGLVTLGSLLAYAYGSRVTAHLRALAGQAAALRTGEAALANAGPVAEANLVGDELAAAAADLRSREAERDRALAALRAETERLEILNRVGAALAAELDVARLVQTVIDAATALSGAAYGAFFERVPAGREGNADEVWRLFALSGARHEEFTRFGMPRATNLFGPTFRAEGVIRVDDVASDPRYGSHGGMPEGHLPVRSYLAVPVRSRSGETQGALLFGHPQPRIFTAREESLIVGFAGQAAIALDNARLFQAAQAEIEQRRAAEAALAEARAGAEEVATVRAAILAQIAEGVIVTDAEGRIVFVNEAATRLHGVARLDVAPEDYAETYRLFTEAGEPHPVEDLPLARAVMRGETVTDARWRIRRPDGTEVLAIGSARPVWSAEGARVGSVLTLRDDTRREADERRLRRLNEALAEQAAELTESNAELQRYAYIVSHDLRAPLVNIMGFTGELDAARADIREALQGSPRAEAIDADMAESLSYIKAAINKMEGLIGAILKLSREGRRTFNPEPLDMTALVRGLVDAQHHQAASAGAQVLVAEPLPDVTADRLSVEQILSNLIDNALKYRHPDRPGRIEVSGERSGSRVRYTVRDNGRGIAPQDHGRVFELFRRAGTQDRPGEGIGLAHVKALVRSLGGRIELASRLGEGSAFTVILPVETTTRAAAPGIAAE